MLSIAALAIMLTPAVDAYDGGRFGSDARWYDGELATLSISPAHLVVPMIEFTGEFSLDRERSIALIGGLGTDAQRGVALYEVGGQYREYILGGFATGVNLGVEGRVSNADYFGYHERMAMMGPFVGAKLTVALFSVDVQGGGQVILRRSGVTVGPLVNLTVGVTF